MITILFIVICLKIRIFFKIENDTNFSLFYKEKWTQLIGKRNFVIYKNHVYSVDEETFGKDFDLEGALKNFYPVIEKYIKKNKDWFGGVLKKYMPTYKDKVEELSHRF